MTQYTNTEACNYTFTGSSLFPTSLRYGWGQCYNDSGGFTEQGNALPVSVGDYRIMGVVWIRFNPLSTQRLQVAIEGDLTSGSDFWPEDLSLTDSFATLNNTSVTESGWTRSYNSTYNFTTYSGLSVADSGTNLGYQTGAVYNSVYAFTKATAFTKTYSDLKSSISAWLKRRTLSDTQIDEFVQLGEIMLRDGVEFTNARGKMVSMALRVREMEITKIYSPGAGDTDADTSGNVISRINLPCNYLEAKRLTYGSKTNLERLTGQSATHWRNVTDTPQGFYRENDFIYITPYPDASEEVTLVYYADFTGKLTDDNDTNDMLTHYYNCYLYSALLAAEPYLVNDKRIDVWESRLLRAIRAANKREERETRSGGFKRMRATF